MSLDLDKAKIMFKLAYSKKNWGAKYDRLEHFKRFQNLKEIIKGLEKKEWLIVHKKPNYTGISLNPKFKKEIVEFIEGQMPDTKGWIN
ncbi:hypothetical protein HYT25_03835 [Candidatus Pacearchaeota archaeon]|nr:hypothetical protein [Candidatus Pacearchaeota archaeon]